MIAIGKVNPLRVVKWVDFGIYLDGTPYGEILMPGRYVPEGTKPGDVLDAFIYLDSEDRIIATTERPKAMVGEFACLEVVGVSGAGAFLDWGLPKDLFVPFREQRQKLNMGQQVPVYIYLDESTNRIVASAKPEKFLDRLPIEFLEGDEVDLMILGETDLGFKAMINGTHTGMLYRNEVFQPLHAGEKLKGYVKFIRTDRKTDLILQKPGYEKVEDISAQLLAFLSANGGFSTLTDKSSAEEIYSALQISKKTFKKAIGGLYKARKIALLPNGIQLIQ